MKILSLVIVALITISVFAATNTTEFWRQQLNISAADMHFQCFSGSSPHIQDIKISIGTETIAQCIISSSAPWTVLQNNQTLKFHSLFGFKVGQEEVHSLEHSQKTDQSESQMENPNCFNTHGIFSDTCCLQTSL